ncbi:hypothetical protein A1QO_04045 [Vibrio genomosp. F10 str. ZF-129]|uniref:Uncharacterized protein n=1 Tax=Vibrio genomosp. F10 str. ZF-129 TaxID=1187848 RepID=A0A1E5BIQ8_9VIBR|nr:hypothetical protein [Vibrio genomosp. F10]OEE37283.1 hypothetical protein A1QO_04045 [Vibrio genomosp. F10 str. ZF-129]
MSQSRISTGVCLESAWLIRCYRNSPDYQYFDNEGIELAKIDPVGHIDGEWQGDWEITLVDTDGKAMAMTHVINLDGKKPNPPSCLANYFPGEMPTPQTHNQDESPDEECLEGPNPAEQISLF